MTPKVSDFKWWADSDPHSKVNEMVRQVEGGLGYRRAMNLHHMRLYADRDLYGAGGVSGSGNAGGGSSLRSRQASSMASLQRNRPKLSVNVVRNVINAATSMLCRSRPRPQYLTSGGDWGLQKKAKKRGQFMEGVFHQEKTHLLGQKMVQMGGILGTGAIKILRDYENKRPRHEIAYIGEILVDEVEGLYGMPRNLFQVRAVDKMVLKEMYGSERAVDQADTAGAAPGTTGGVADLAVVVEAWHLPSSANAGDGRHAICTSAGTLWEERYAHNDFPFAFWRWEEDPLGFFGTGLASELSGIQYEINETIRAAQANWWNGGGLRVFVERGANVMNSALANSLRCPVVEYTGQAPVFSPTNAVAPGMMDYLKFLISTAYEISGISQLNAQNQTPAASMSGRARLIADHNESQRFLTAQRRYEQAFMDIADRTMEACEDIYQHGSGRGKQDFEVMFAGKEHLDPIKYSEIRAGKDVFEIAVFPTSIMPSLPAGKLAMVEQLQALGIITDRSQVISLLDFPDLQREMDFEKAPQDIVDNRIQKILEDGEYIAPHPDMDLQLALNRTLKALLHAENIGVPEENIDQLRKFRDAVTMLIEKQTPPQPPPMPPEGPGGPGGGLPMAPPGAAMPDQAANVAAMMGGVPQAA